MTTIDLGPAPNPGSEPWAGVPRRVGLTLPELTSACTQIGAPLPFEALPQRDDGLQSRLGVTREGTEDEALARTLTGYGDGEASLRRRDLLGDSLDSGIAGALGLLATPEIVVDVDVVVDGVRAHAWHRQQGDAAASLATVDGLVFELSWYPARSWAAELGRVATLPSETVRRTSRVPDHLEVPYAVADAVLEAIRTGRADLIPTLTSGDSTLAEALTAVAEETHGRLRAVVATAGDPETSPIGIVSWTLVADGWRALRTTSGDELLLTMTSVEPSELAADLAPVLAEVAR
ncbi:MAG: hypothetical protein J2O46_03900 [Nocardioides sp.]|nr:hypothetical protein [Nocardioides sp.]